jgi:hypothetical protein
VGMDFTNILDMENLTLNTALIQDEMDRRKISYSELSVLSGIRRNSIYKMLKRRRASFINLGRLAKALNRSPKDLLI